MPELAEIKIMSEYINDSCAGEDFTSISVSPEVVRRLSLVQPSNLQLFSISAKARGKELMLILSSGKDQYLISASMGMSGYWQLADDLSTPKHAHLKFHAVSGKRLCLVDARRFARWKWSDGWVSHRGPCPLSEPKEFVQNIVTDLHKRAFNRPIHIVLMDQRYFNGIGNYLRAEILYRADQNPFVTAREAITSNPKILELCSQAPFESYLIGGGQLKDWQNPFNVPSGGFADWIKCYGKSDDQILDVNGRTLWYFKSQLNQSS
jgi:endonuclease VIII-like 1